MNEDSIYWILGVGAIGLLITIIGQVTSRNLPEKQKKILIQKFGAVAIALIAMSIPIFKPFIFSYSSAKYQDELKAENLNSVEDFSRFEKEQTRQIESLKRDIVDLRDDLRNLNQYYGMSNQILWSGIGVVAILFAFRKRKNEDLEEIQKEQIPKL